MEDKNPSLKGSRSSNTKSRAHHQSKIQSTDMNQNAFENIVTPPQICSAHSPGLIKMSKWPFQKFSSFPEQRFASLSTYSSAIGIDGCLRLFIAAPSSAPLLRFRNIRTQSKPVHVNNSLGAVRFPGQGCCNNCGRFLQVLRK